MIFYSAPLTPNFSRSEGVADPTYVSTDQLESEVGTFKHGCQLSHKLRGEVGDQEVEGRDERDPSRYTEANLKTKREFDGALVNI